MAERLWPRERIRKVHVERRWSVKYSLIYEFGDMSNFTEYYRTKLGAKISAFIHVNLRSYGGTAVLYEKEA